MQDVLHVRLAPRRHDRSVPMLSMDARPLYLRLLGAKMVGCLGVITRRRVLHFFPGSRGCPSTLSQSAAPEWIRHTKGGDTERSARTGIFEARWW